MKVNASQNVSANNRLPRSATQSSPVRPPELNLLNAASSSEVAKETLEKTFARLSPSQKILLSRQLGYDSFSNMLAASTVATLSDGSTWWLTADRYGAWTAWNLCQLDFPYSAESDGDAPLPRKPR